MAARPFLPGTAPVSAHGLACLAPRSARGEAAGRLGASVPRQPPGQNVDSTLERRKEPRFSCSVPKPLQPLSFLCTQLPKPPFSSLTIPHSSPSSSAFPLASTIRLSFSCLGSCQLLAACSFLLPPFPFLTLLPVLSLTFSVCMVFTRPPPSLLLSPRSFFLTTGSTLLGRMKVPPRLFADPQRELLAPSLCPWLLAARGASPALSKCKGTSRAQGQVGTLLRIPRGAQS